MADVDRDVSQDLAHVRALGYPGEIIAVVARFHRDLTEREVRVYVVLVAGAVGDYAAYEGVGSHAAWQTHAAKIPYREAAARFPTWGLRRGSYRD